jgi:hypothetical protein
VSEGNLYIILGCFGLRQDDFVSCAGIENRILRIQENLVGYAEMMNYLDQCRLFDKPTFEYNSVRHFIFNMQDRFDQNFKRLWPEKRFELLQKFTIDHRHCGIYIKLVLVDPKIIVEPDEPKGILIPGSKMIDESVPTHSLRVVRGR